MENQEINLEKVHSIIEKLQSEATSGQLQSMLALAHDLVGSLQEALCVSASKEAPRRTESSVSVVMPFSSSFGLSTINAESNTEPQQEQQMETNNTATTSSSTTTDNEPVSTTAATQVPEEEEKQVFSLEPDEMELVQQYKVPTPPASSTSTQALKEKDVVTALDSKAVNKEAAPIADAKAPQNNIQVSPTTPAIKSNTTAEEPISPPENKEAIAEQKEDQQHKEYQEDKDADQATEEAKKRKHLAFIEDNFSAWASYGLEAEAPTLVQNESLAQPTSTAATSSKSIQPAASYKELNEQFGGGQVEEWAQKMQTTPIENLSSAIGINDRYLFISELFRGDESMYERSIITLNKFNNFHEAHTWSQRELSLKLGWDADSAITKQFEQLIKRRFTS